jgi:hypothetical protein
MQRRKFIKLIAAVAALPFTVRAQQRAMPIVGFINSESSKTYARFLDAFAKGCDKRVLLRDETLLFNIGGVRMTTSKPMILLLNLFVFP